jgi:hypothetical protein
MKFTEAQLEKAFADLLAKEGYPHCHGQSLNRKEEADAGPNGYAFREGEVNDKRAFQ